MKIPHNQKLVMNFIIWNTRGANSSKFRRHYSYMVKLHNPAMFFLLETRMADHKHLTSELQFNAQIQSPAAGQSSGIVVM